MNNLWSAVEMAAWVTDNGAERDMSDATRRWRFVMRFQTQNCEQVSGSGTEHRYGHSCGEFMRKACMSIVCLHVILFSTLCVFADAFAQNSSDRRFIWIGNEDRQFTAEEFNYIAKKHAIAVIAKFHGGWDLSKQHWAAEQIKKRNPSIKVFPYFSANYWWSIEPYAFSYGQRAFKEAWYLHDLNDDWTTAQNPVEHRVEHIIVKNGRTEISHYLDLCNVPFCNWASGTIAVWLQRTIDDMPVYAGIAFDAATIHNVYRWPDGQPPGFIEKLMGLIGGTEEQARQKIMDLNDGRLDLVRRTRERIGNKMILYNGFHDSPSAFKRSLAFFEYADAALEEDFCYQPGLEKLHSKKRILQDIDLISGVSGKYLDKIFLLKTNIPNSDSLTLNQRLKLRRFSYGCFLLGHRPGRTFYKYAEFPLYFTQGNVGIDPLEIELEFGDPLAKYRGVGNVYARHFKKGSVYVNMEDTAQSVTIPWKLVLMNGGVAGKVYKKEQVLKIPAKDAAFLLKPIAP